MCGAEWINRWIFSSSNDGGSIRRRIRSFDTVANEYSISIRLILVAV